MSDLIDRQAAIDAIEQMQMPIMRSEFAEEQFVFRGMSEALDAIKQLPSAEPERKKGEWIQKSRPLDLCTEWWYECSECGVKPCNDCYGHPNHLSSFCPNCGARMDGDTDG